MTPPYALHIQEMAESKESRKQKCLRNQIPHLSQNPSSHKAAHLGQPIFSRAAQKKNDHHQNVTEEYDS